jgi:hypothetical protein
MGERCKHVLAVRDNELDVRHDGTRTHRRLPRDGHMWKCPGIL